VSIALQSIKAGDQVYVEMHGLRGDLMLIQTVDKVTAWQIVIDGVRYRRSGGQQIDHEYSKWTVVPITEESTRRYEALRTKRQEAKDRARLRYATDAPKLPIEAVRKCLAILDECMLREG